MEFDINFLGKFPYLSGFFLENPCIKRKISTMNNPLQGSFALAPPPPPKQNNDDSTMLLLDNNFHHFHLNLNHHHSNFVMEGGPSSSSINHHLRHPFFSSSSLTDLFEAATTNGGSLMKDIITPNYRAFAPPNNNNKMAILDALHSHDNDLQVMGPTLFPSSSLVYDEHYGSVPMNHNINKLKLQDKFSSIAAVSNTQQRGEVVGTMMKQKRVLAKQSSKVQLKISNIIKGQWTPEEDRLLIQLVKHHGLKKWSQIAKLLSGRVGKQCRERWHNHLRPNIRKESWTEEEDRVLIEAHQEVGNKWVEIARRLPGRTENTIKNHWNAIKRCQNSKKQKNKHTTSKRTLLMNYINQVIEAEEATKELKNSMSKMKVINVENCINNDHHQGFQVRYGSSEGDLSLEHRATTAKEDGWSLEHHVFPRNDSGYVPKMDINADGMATRSRSVVDESTNVDYEVAMEMENFMREVQMSKEMDLMKMIYKNT